MRLCRYYAKYNEVMQAEEKKTIRIRCPKCQLKLVDEALVTGKAAPTKSGLRWLCEDEAGGVYEGAGDLKACLAGRQRVDDLHFLAQP